MKKITSLFLMVIMLLNPVSAVATADTGFLKPDHPLYFLDGLWDSIHLKLLEIGRALRIVSDDKVAEFLKELELERQAELQYLEQKGKQNTSLYERVREQYEERHRHYVEYVKSKLAVNYTIDGYEVILKVTNIWDKKITYVTGGFKAKNYDTGEEISYTSPIPYLLNLEPGETKVYTLDLSGYDGTWFIHVKVFTWDGHKLINAIYEVTIPG